MSRLFLLVLIVLLTSCKSTPPSLKISKAELKNKYSKIGLMWFQLPKEFEQRRDSIQQQFDERLKEQLQYGNFEIIDRDIVVAEYGKVTNEMNGFYDSTTGKILPNKVLEIKKETFRRLKEKFGITAFLYQGVSIETAYLQHHQAIWDNHHEPYRKNNNALENVVSSLFVTETGRVPALSYYLSLVDENNESLYRRYGGIQLLAKLIQVPLNEGKQNSTVKHWPNGRKKPRVKFKSDFEYLTFDQLLVNPVNISNSVDRAAIDLIKAAKSE